MLARRGVARMLTDIHKEKRKTLICTAHLIQSLVICFVTLVLFSLLFRSCQRPPVDEKENVCFTFSYRYNPC